MNLIDKDALVAEVDRLIERAKAERVLYPKTILSAKNLLLLEDYDSLKNFINTLEVKDPYEQIVQYDSIKAGIQAHAETYSFNIESELFNQLTEEQQKLWRKEIEQACISGGEAGVELARDIRYKENLEVKEVGVWKTVDNINLPQADRNKIYCVLSKGKYLLAKVINHPHDELLQWCCTEFPFHCYDMCEGDKYMQIV